MFVCSTISPIAGGFIPTTVRSGKYADLSIITESGRRERSFITGAQNRPVKFTAIRFNTKFASCRISNFPSSACANESFSRKSVPFPRVPVDRRKETVLILRLSARSSPRRSYLQRERTKIHGDHRPGLPLARRLAARRNLPAARTLRQTFSAAYRRRQVFLFEIRARSFAPGRPGGQRQFQKARHPSGFLQSRSEPARQRSHALAAGRLRHGISAQGQRTGRHRLPVDLSDSDRYPIAKSRSAWRGRRARLKH